MKTKNRQENKNWPNFIVPTDLDVFWQEKSSFGCLTYLEQAIVVKHVSTQEQIKGPVEQWEVTSGALFLGIHDTVLVPHFLDVFSDTFSTLCGLLHFLLQIVDVLVVLLQGTTNGLLIVCERKKFILKKRTKFTTERIITVQFYHLYFPCSIP